MALILIYNLNKLKRKEKIQLFMKELMMKKIQMKLHLKNKTKLAMLVQHLKPDLEKAKDYYHTLHYYYELKKNILLKKLY